jgi:hypothetical protein
MLVAGWPVMVLRLEPSLSSVVCVHKSVCILAILRVVCIPCASGSII